MQEKNLDQNSENPTFEIVGCYYKDNCLPSLNDLLHEATRHPQAYAKLKRDMEWVVTKAIRQYGINPINQRVALNITWTEKDKGRKRDYDNIVSAGRKIINDALVKNCVLKDDSPTYLGYGENHFEYGRTPKVKIEIVGIESI